jgi:hypothetical protein
MSQGKTACAAAAPPRSWSGWNSISSRNDRPTNGPEATTLLWTG